MPSFQNFYIQLQISMTLLYMATVLIKTHVYNTLLKIILNITKYINYLSSNYSLWILK